MREGGPREFGAATARRQYHWDTRPPSLSIPPLRESEVREGQAQRYVRITLPTALDSDIFSTSGYFEITRSPLVLFLLLRLVGTILS